ncbi:hypothetical protein COT62_02390 [Candidatus Roizmanbacteria bacterium CG09_land_8_20_14_0_10_41_9]|uniref:Uncharacterized protein n=1 Tax=Candidatus Roizmanbacteria bacterium CG09_land_8_20_14_0_10_41_9 TaxID=1974850 RepID=A0A2H0WSQ0_9BACT|nr:MAG: hypothetical protein COT62_02390 [Candidatus Roizmanbacteria bacterium CG09_land_8_20_14_0_10_41_9]
MDPLQNKNYTPLPPNLSAKPVSKSHSLLNTFLALGVTFSVLVLIVLVTVLIQKQSIQLNSKASSNKNLTPAPPSPTPTSVVSPTSIPSGSDEADLEAIDVGSIEADLKDIDADFQGL